eukprot:6455538-Amphidinium_carterae.1
MKLFYPESASTAMHGPGSENSVGAHLHQEWHRWNKKVESLVEDRFKGMGSSHAGDVEAAGVESCIVHLWERNKLHEWPQTWQSGLLPRQEFVIREKDETVHYVLCSTSRAALALTVNKTGVQLDVQWTQSSFHWLVNTDYTQWSVLPTSWHSAARNKSRGLEPRICHNVLGVPVPLLQWLCVNSFPHVPEDAIRELVRTLEVQHTGEEKGRSNLSARQAMILSIVAQVLPETSVSQAMQSLRDARAAEHPRQYHVESVEHDIVED